jgi:plasmid maintenance system killer protein
MKVTLQQRAEIARRSLTRSDKNQVGKAIASLNELNFEKALSSPDFHKLAGLSQTQLYAYRVNNRLRLIISIDGDKWFVEDIVDHLGHLNRLFPLQDKA